MQTSAHPALLVTHLEGMHAEIVRALLAGPTSQVKLMGRLATPVTQSTLSRAMRRLTEQGIVKKSGTTRDAVFELTPAAAHFARPPHQRPRVDYDNRIEAYVPNKTRWLPVEAEERMRQAAGQVAHRLDAATYSRRIAERFLIDLAWASSHLEGNTYEYLEAEVLIKYAEKAQGHDWTEATMILNHKRAITLLLDSVVATSQPIVPELMHRLHSLLMRDLLAPEWLGRVRDGGTIRIGGSSYQPTPDRNRLTMDMGALCWAAEETQNPFEAGFLLLAGMAYLQAYGDGNKRTSRLSCNLPLLRAGLPPLSFLSVEPGAYTRAIVVFYELGDPSLLADVVSRAYAETAPVYTASMETQRTPRTAELRNRDRINHLVSEIVQASVAGTPVDESMHIATALSDLPDEDRQVVTDAILAALAAVGPNNHDAWDVPAKAAAAFANARAARAEDDKHSTQPG